MRTYIAIALITVFGCKARNHNDTGLLDASRASGSERAFDVRCEGVENGAAFLAYDLKISASSEAEAFTVEIAKIQSGAATVLNVDSTATGVVSESGPLSIASTGGVLSAEKAADDQLHLGVLTVFGDPVADALDVRCRVAVTSAL